MFGVEGFSGDMALDGARCVEMFAILAFEIVTDVSVRVVGEIGA